MYRPAHFDAPDAAALQALMRAHPLAVLCHHGADGVDADHVPLRYDAAAHVLRGHVARANPLWRRAAGQPVLAVFRGPQGYVSPTWTAAKAETHQVVPTWNYTVVHAHGVLQPHDDAAWLLDVVTQLTARHEAVRTPPWAVSDAPRDYIERMLRAIVGIEIAVSRLEGKWKVSQNRSAADRRGIAAGLALEPGADGPALAALVTNPGHPALD